MELERRELKVAARFNAALDHFKPAKQEDPKEDDTSAQFSHSEFRTLKGSAYQYPLERLAERKYAKPNMRLRSNNKISQLSRPQNKQATEADIEVLY